MSAHSPGAPAQSDGVLSTAPRDRRVRIIASLDTAIGRLIEAVGVGLLVIEVVILLAGVVARYALNAPIVWVDELATALLLWLSMIGAIAALRRGEHMRVSAIVDHLPMRWRIYCRWSSYYRCWRQPTHSTSQRQS